MSRRPGVFLRALGGMLGIAPERQERYLRKREQEHRAVTGGDGTVIGIGTLVACDDTEDAGTVTAISPGPEAGGGLAAVFFGEGDFGWYAAGRLSAWRGRRQ